jgi:hypothetical protein
MYVVKICYGKFVTYMLAWNELKHQQVQKIKYLDR